MRRRSSTNVEDDVADLKDSEAHELGVKKQLALFWFSDPQLVIAIIQFMQFSYALALAILLIFWEDMKLGSVEPWWYLVAVLGCYTIFLLVTGQVIPQFTLCTSLGHLVHQRHLQETLAKYRLEEAQRRQKRQLAALAYEQLQKHQEQVLQESFSVMEQSNNEHISVPGQDEGSINKAGTIPTTIIASERDETSTFGIHADPSNQYQISGPPATSSFLRAPINIPSDLALNATGSFGAGKSSILMSAMENGDEDDKTMRLSELVKMDTSSLRTSLPQESRENLLSREQRMKERRSRRKAVSDGVAAMRAFGKGASPAVSNLLLKPAETLGLGKRRGSFPKNDVSLAPNTTSSKPQTQDDSVTLTQDRAERARRRRENRSKSVSASAVIQSWRDFSTAPGDTGASIQSNTSFFANPRRRTPRSRSTTPPLGLHPLVEEHPSTELGHLSSPESDTVEEVTRNENNHSAFFGLAPPLEGENEDEHEDNNELSVGKGDGSGSSQDEDTVDTAKSVGDLSDVVDIPGSENGFELRAVYKPKSWTSTALKWLSPTVALEWYRERFVVSQRNAIASHVLGTLVCLFLVGQRIEAMLAASNVIDKSENTWELRLRGSFWWEVSWLVIFIIGSAIIILLFSNFREAKKKERKLLIAAVLDIFVSGTCLVLLFIAEHRRCCSSEEREELEKEHGDSHRLLAAAVNDEGYESDYYSVDTECCPGWGERTYTGLGWIEPWTGLIILRLLRFLIADFIYAYFSKKKKKAAELQNSQDQAEELKEDIGTTHRPVLEELLNENGNRPAMSNEKGTPLELWERAIHKYPDIVEKYGEFSGELFQAMLGLRIIDELQPQPLSSSEKPSTNDQHESPPCLEEDIEDELRPIRLSGKQYIDLPVEAQGIILAGKLGKPVKSMANLMEHFEDESSNNVAVSVTEEEVQAVKKQTRKMTPSSRQKAACEFQIDKVQLEEESRQPNLSMLIAPNARVLRSMRRCDRRLLPLLSTWTTVDIVMTRFEIVYFDPLTSGDGEEEYAWKENTLLALKATKGGKGLRLCDVVAGRQIVGHLDLSEVSEVHVERDFPLPAEAISDLLARDSTTEEDLPKEYWCEDHHKTPSKSCLAHPSRNARWAQIKEDRLKLVSMHGTLYLRFFSDLEDAESSAERKTTESETSGPLTKNIALQWGQTVARLVGKDQLQQSLPHLGEDNSDELRDFLEMVPFHEKELEKERKGHSRKRSSMAFSTNLLAAMDDHKHERPSLVRRASSTGEASRAHLHASSSFGEDLATGIKKKASSRHLKRAQSTGDSECLAQEDSKMVQDGVLLGLEREEAPSKQVFEMGPADDDEKVYNA